MLTQLHLGKKRLSELQQRLGQAWSQPGGRQRLFWLGVLWLATGISILAPPILLVAYVNSSFPGSQPLNNDAFLITANACLAIGVVAFGLHRLARQAGSISGRTYAIAVTLIVLLAIIAYIVVANLPLIPTFFGLELPASLSWLTNYIALVVPPLLLLALVMSQQERVWPGWWIAVIGGLAGAILLLVLAFPVYTLLYNAFVPEVNFTGPAHERSAIASFIVAGVVALLTGPTGVLLSQSRNRRSRLLAGGLSGAFTGLILFGGLGNAVTGVIANEPLYGVALSRAGYGEAEWVLKLAIAINNIFPLTYVAFWMVIISGALVGSFLGWLTPAGWLLRKQPLGQTSERSIEAEQAWWSGFLSAAVPALGLAIIANVAVLALLGSQIRDVFEQFGVDPGWQPEWIVLSAVFQPWTILTAVQLMGLRWLTRLADRTTPRPLPGLVGIMTGVIGIGLIPILYSISPAFVGMPWARAALLFTALLSTGLLHRGWRCWQQAFSAGGSIMTPAANRRWGMNGGIVGGVVGAVMIYQLFTAPLNLVLIAVSMIADLTNSAAPPPGLPWLLNILDAIFGVNLVAFLAMIIPGVTTGAVFGFALTNWPWPQWLHTLTSRLSRIIRPQLESGVARLKQRKRPSARFFALAIGAIVVLALSIRFGLFIPLVTLAAAVYVIILKQPLFARLSWPVLAAAFVVTLSGLVALNFLGLSLLLDARGGAGLLRQAAFVFLFFPALILTFRAIETYGPKESRALVHGVILVGIPLFAGLLGAGSPGPNVVAGGLARFDGQAWENRVDDNLVLSGRVNYQFYADEREQLWLGGGHGIIIGRIDEEWKTFSTFLTANRPENRAGNSYFVEDGQGHLWIAQGERVQQYIPTLAEFRQPGQIQETSDISSGCAIGAVQLWDITGKRLATFTGMGTAAVEPGSSYGGQVGTVAFSPDGTRLLAVEQSNSEPERSNVATLWATSGDLITIIGRATTVRLSPDGSLIVGTHGDGSIRIWDWDGRLWQQVTDPLRSLMQVEESYDDSPIQVALNQDNSQLLVARKNEALVTEIEGGTLFRLEGHTSDIEAASFSPTAGYILTLQTDGVARLWNDNGAFITTLGSNDVTSAVFHPDSTAIVTASQGAIQFWDTGGNRIRTFEVRDLNPVDRLLFSPTGDYFLAVLGDGQTELRDGQGNLITTVEGVGLQVSADGKRIATLDGEGAVRLWDEDGESMAAFGSDPYTVETVAFSPDNNLIASGGCVREGAYRIFSPGEGGEAGESAADIVDMAADGNGNVWLATDGNGVVRLERSAQPTNMGWTFFRESDAARHVSDVHVDRSGAVWAGSEGGLRRFDGQEWEEIQLPRQSNPSVNTIFEDSQGRLWLGTAHGGFWLEDESWTPFSTANQWPGETAATQFFEDSNGNVWAGTAAGALRYDGQGWIAAIPDVEVTKFVEDEAGNLWIGTRGGLERYHIASKELAHFTQENSGMAADWVRDMYVDSDGKLWVSAYETVPTAATFSPWWGIGLGLIVFGYLFGQTYQGYQRAAETRARRLWRQLKAAPDDLYAVVYRLLAETPDAPEVLRRLARYLTTSGDVTAGKVVDSLAQFSRAPGQESLGETIRALDGDRERPGARTLKQLHHLLSQLLAVKRVPAIVELELVANPGQSAETVAIHTRQESIKSLSPFLIAGTVAVWQALEKVGVALRKYQAVDAATDQLSYLAEALAAVEAAQSAVKTPRSPEEVVLAQVTNQWRMAITQTINAVSGQADLRLELRTRQLRRAGQVTIVMRLLNIGRASAEEVHIAFYQDDVEVTAQSLAQLAAGRTEMLEFAVKPPADEMMRISCHVTWKDRVAERQSLDFGDVVRFYETAQAFSPIPNPYVVGHPIKSSAMFHGREDVFGFIAQNLDGTTDRTLVLHGQRRTGKTSVLYQLLNGRLGPGFLPVLIDMQELAPIINSTGDFLSEVAYQLARAMRQAGMEISEPEPERFERAAVRVFNRFLDQVEESLEDRRLIIMFDEFELIESKIAAGKLDADLLGYFRSLMQHRQKLVFIFTGTHRLEEMSHDYWSILFNIALYRRLSFLDRDNAVRLIREPVADHLDVDELAVDKIISLSQGHPYFTQLICWGLVDHCNGRKRNYATINDVNDAVDEILKTGEAHFAYVWQQANHGARLALAALAHVLRPGKAWARPDELLEALKDEGDKGTTRADLINTLDRLVAQEVLESASEGSLRYRFQLELLQLWVARTQSVTALVERQAGH